jgi:hypothetical protein
MIETQVNRKNSPDHRIHKLMTEVETLIEEYQSKVKAGFLQDIPLHNDCCANLEAK